jgi:AraC family transcriptional regulator
VTLANEIDGGFVDGILADALNTALAVQVTRRFVDPSVLILEPSSGLTRERLKRVQDYIEAHLDDRLTLTDLAGVACLSPDHFSRSFKQAVGVGPQRSFWNVGGRRPGGRTSRQSPPVTPGCEL